MKVIHINNADSSGGAARAAYRIHHALLSNEICSRMWVSSAKSGDWTVTGPRGKLNKGYSENRRHLITPIFKTMRTQNNVLHSPAILPSSWSKKINKNDADIAQLHWVGAEMASIKDIGRIKKPVVWTLHDMWAFCGAEHYSWDQRWMEGYNKDNRSSHEKGFDLNRWTFNRKLKYWKDPFHIVAVSKWLAECAQESILMKDFPVTSIPNCLDTKIWKPIEKKLARELLNLPKDIPIIAFGTYGANSQYIKGFDLLLDALKNLKGEIDGMEIAIFGQLAPQNPISLGFPINFMGHLNDDITLRLLYSAVDLLVVPSRKEAFGQTASESMACSTPVVAFGATGLLDIVDHKVNGYLAKPFDSEDLANGIKYIFDNPNYDDLCRNARKKVVNEFDSKIVSDQYEKLYRKILK